MSYYLLTKLRENGGCLGALALLVLLAVLAVLAGCSSPAAVKTADGTVLLSSARLGGKGTVRIEHGGTVLEQVDANDESFRHATWGLVSDRALGRLGEVGLGWIKAWHALKRTQEATKAVGLRTAADVQKAQIASDAADAAATPTP